MATIGNPALFRIGRAFTSPMGQLGLVVDGAGCAIARDACLRSSRHGCGGQVGETRFDAVDHPHIVKTFTIIRITGD
jgi:hypothetical protein